MSLRNLAFTAAFAVSALAAAPALALPDTAAELHDVVATGFGADPNAWVEKKGNDFRTIGCRNRADLLQHLIDDGLAISRISTQRLLPFYACALQGDEEEVLALIAEPESLARLERDSARWGLPLHYAVGRDNHANTLVLLRNGAHLWDKRELALQNYTRDGQLLNAAGVAVQSNNMNALRAFEDAGLGDIVADARDKGFLHIVGQLALERDGKGGGLLGGLVDMALTAALGSSPTDFLIASAGSRMIGGSGSQGSAGSSAQRADMRKRMARYLRNVDAAPEPAASVQTATKPAAAQAQEAAPALSTVEELERLADLHDRGVITDEEFDQLKAKAIADR